MRGRIEKLAVLPSLWVTWRPGSSSTQGIPDYYVFKLLELEKSDDVDGHEVWKDPSGWLRDCSSINMLVKDLLSAKQSSIFAFNWSFTTTFGVVIKLKDDTSKQFHFTTWEWQP